MRPDEKMEFSPEEARGTAAALGAEVRALRLLSDLGAALGEATGREPVLRMTARACVGALADWCVIDLIGADRTRELSVCAHVDADKVPLLERLRAAYPPERLPESATMRVYESGRPVLEPAATEAAVRAVNASADYLDLVQQLGPRSWLAVPLPARGRILGVLALASARRSFDAFDLRTAEEVGRRAGLAVDNALAHEQAQRAIASRDDLLAVVSHDLRNSLSPLFTATALLLRPGAEQKPERMRRHLEMIDKTVRRMTHLVDDLLDAGSIEAGRFTVTRTRQPVGTLVDDVAELLGPAAGERGVRLEAATAAREAEASFDRERVFQALANLAGNALKFSPAGGVVRLAAGLAGGEIVFSVIDEGPGIPEEHLPHLFERYWRGGGGSGGRGLGLFIAQGIVAAHDGRIWAERGRPRGAALYFTLPLAPG